MMRRVFSILMVAITGAMGSASFAASAKELRPKYVDKDFYLQYNLYHEDEDAIWVNFIGLGAFVPIGTKVHPLKLTENKMILQVEGRTEKLILEIEDCTPDLETVLDRLLGNEPPSLEGFDEIDLKGIKAAQVRKGMSRKAIFAAVGPPPRSYAPPFRSECNNSDIEADQLCYAKDTWDFLLISFENEKVSFLDD